jgi:hypothetical protein
VICDCKYEEGKHYQFLCYGGKLLSHYSAEETTELIGILTLNRNAAIVIDSDKKNRNASINDTKIRIVNEFKNYKMFSWITKGKEVENYLSSNAISLSLEKTVSKQCSQYEDFADYIEPFYSSFRREKVSFANRVKQVITKENSKDILDLRKHVIGLFEQIQLWNR